MKIASEQIKLNKRINSLLEKATFAFSFAQDASRLDEGDGGHSSLRGAIIQLIDQLIECSLFIREYARKDIISKLPLDDVKVFSNPPLPQNAH